MYAYLNDYNSVIHVTRNLTFQMELLPELVDWYNAVPVEINGHNIH